jgi:Raf kinase inhibitor-like YbhB/YbcL family protein
MALSISSPAFEEGGKIPSKYTCDADNVSPEIRIEGVPEGTVSFVLVMDDPDIPDTVKQARGIEKFDHWAVYNIGADTTVLAEGKSVGTGAVNSTGKTSYTGPCPPDREHRYFFRLYALSGTLNFIQAPTLDELETAARGMMIESATLMGRYERIP